MHRRRRVSSPAIRLAVVAALPAVSAVASPLPQYANKDLGTLSGGNNSYAFAINNNGVIAGGSNVSAGGFQHPVVFSGNTVHDLGIPAGAASAIALDINNGNEVVGGDFPHFTSNKLMIDPSPTYLGGFDWKPPVVVVAGGGSGAVDQLAHDPFAFGGSGSLSAAHPSYTALNGIADNGLIAGTAIIPGGATRAATGGPDSAPGSLGVLGTGNQSRATNMSPGGLITGWSNTPGRTRGFLSIGSGLTEYGADAALNGNGNSTLNDVAQQYLPPNYTGASPVLVFPKAAGWADSAAGSHRAAVWGTLSPNSPSFFTELPDSFASEINSINAHALSVGYSNINGFDLHASAFVSGKTYDLNAIAPVGVSNFFQLSMATGVNDHGQIVGYGLTKNNQIHAFLLTPVPATVSAGNKNGQDNPLLPDGTANNGQTYSFNNVPSGSWVDPAADDLHYEITTPGAHFTSITLPDSFTGLSVLIDGEPVATNLAPLSQLTFTFDVTHFDVVGFNPALDTGTPNFFPLKVAFDTPTANLELTPFLTPVPEPASLFAACAVVIPLSRRRRRWR